MNAKVIVGILLVVVGLVLIYLGVSSILSPAASCFGPFCIANPFGWVGGAVTSIVGLVVLAFGVKVI